MIDVCAAIIEKEGLVLAARRKTGSHLAGFWEFPGGKMELNESEEGCLARELNEEFGIEAKIGDYIGKSIFAYDEKTICLKAYRVLSFKGELQPVDHDAIQWLTIDELDAVEWAPADIPLVERYKAIRSTESFYRSEAAAYAGETDSLDVSHLYKAFLAQLSPFAHILDAGCGAGRDSYHFLKQGFKVTALDASPALAALAEQKIQQPVAIKSFDKIRDHQLYDAIWANASLLHCPKDQIHKIMRRLITALKIDGVFFMSFKKGVGEALDHRGRFFNFYTKDSLTQLLTHFPELTLQECWETTAPLRDIEQQWVNAIAVKKGHFL